MKRFRGLSEPFGAIFRGEGVEWPEEEERQEQLRALRGEKERSRVREAPRMEIQMPMEARAPEVNVPMTEALKK